MANIDRDLTNWYFAFGVQQTAFYFPKRKEA
jgi:hypothetical protein